MCETLSSAVLLPASRLSALAARDWASRSECAQRFPSLLDDALLLISELVTNAVMHGRPTIVLAIGCDRDGLRVYVRDGSATLPQPRDAGPGADGGRGMHLVGLLSHSWGVNPVDDAYGVGKEVWFELRR